MNYDLWDNFYNVIKQANLVLYNTPILVTAGKITPVNGDNYMGQAYCMRAFAYFWVIRVWGDAPLVLAPFTDGRSIKEVRKPSEQVLDTIQSDLDKAAVLIPSASIDRFTFTRTAVYAIQAQVNAWRHNWPAVITSADKILNSTTTNPIVNSNYSLVQLYDSVAAKSFFGDILNDIMINTEYSKMFNIGSSKESIFELPFSATDYENNNSLFGLLGDTYPTIKPRPEFMGQYLTNDWRQHINSWSTEKAMKYFNGTFVKTTDVRNIVLLRLAETALLKAEALLFLNDTEPDSLTKVTNTKSAMDIVNLIRYRAGGPTLMTPDSTYLTYGAEQIKDIVLDERKLELAFEGHRYFDLIRTGNVARIMGPINGQTNPLSFVWPIQLDEIRNSNGVLIQNEYYK